MTNEDQNNEYISAVDSSRMMSQSVAHGVYSWVESLERDNLKNLGMLVHAALGNPALGWQVIGMIEGELRHRFKECYVCSQDHDAEAAHMMEATKDQMIGEGIPIPGTPFHTGDADAFEGLNIPERTFVQYIALCAKYGVTSAVEQGDEVFCKNCNMRYPDLDDRMIKEPDDCPGCQVFTGTGVKFAPPGK